MKVAVIIDFWFPAAGGGQINAWEISKRLAQKGLNIDIITRNCGEDNLEKIPNLKIYKLGPETKPDSLISELYFLARLCFFVLPKDYDLIHVHPFLPALVAKLLSLLKNIPIIMTVHGTRLFEPEKKTPSRLLEKYIVTGIKYDSQISVTKAFLKIPNVNKKKVVIPNGVDVSKFAKDKITKFPNKTILYVGRFDPVKRVEDLILATKELSKQVKSVKTVLVGYGYQQAKLKKLVKDLNLQNIQFAGFKTKDELITLYRKSHVFVLPSDSEGQPLTILEAQAASLPVVATNVGGVPEIIKDGETGLLVPPRNPHKLAEAILMVFKRKNKFRRSAFENIQKVHNWDTITQRTYKLYRQVLS